MTKALHALDYSSASSPHVIAGVGDLTEARVSTIYLPDDAGIWQSFLSGIAGRVYANLQWWLYSGPACTNLQIRSNDQTDAEWAAVNMTVAQDAVGMRNDANAACTLTATAANATVLANAITAASSDQTIRWFLKRLTGSGVIEITVDGGTTWQDVTTEVDSSSGFNEAMETLAALANPQIGIRIVTSGDAVVVGNAELFTSKSISQVKDSSPIFTAGSTVTANACDLGFDIANHDNTEGAYYCEIKNVGFDGTNSIGVITMHSSGRILYANTASSFLSYDGSTIGSASSGGFAADDTEYKIALAYGSSFKRIKRDDNWGAANAYDGAFTLGSKLEVLRDQANGVPTVVLFLRNLRRYDMTYADALVAIPDMMNGDFPSEERSNYIAMHRRTLDRPPTKAIYPKSKMTLRDLK